MISNTARGLRRTPPSRSPVNVGVVSELRLTDLSCHGQALGVGDRGQLLVPQPLDGVLVVPQVKLGAHQDDGGVGAVVSHFRIPLPTAPHNITHARTHTHTHAHTRTRTRK